MESKNSRAQIIVFGFIFFVRQTYLKCSYKIYKLASGAYGKLFTHLRHNYRLGHFIAAMLLWAAA